MRSVSRAQRFWMGKRSWGWSCSSCNSRRTQSNDSSSGWQKVYFRHPSCCWKVFHPALTGGRTLRQHDVVTEDHCSRSSKWQLLCLRLWQGVQRTISTHGDPMGRPSLSPSSRRKAFSMPKTPPLWSPPHYTAFQREGVGVNNTYGINPQKPQPPVSGINKWVAGSCLRPAVPKPRVPNKPLCLRALLSVWHLPSDILRPIRRVLCRPLGVSSVNK